MRGKIKRKKKSGDTQHLTFSGPRYVWSPKNMRSAMHTVHLLLRERAASTKHQKMDYAAPLLLRAIIATWTQKKKKKNITHASRPALLGTVDADMTAASA